MMIALRYSAAVALSIAVATILTACSSDSISAAATSSNGTAYDFSGYYTRDDGAFVSGQRSGQTVTSLRLTQYGTRLDAFDNANMTWDGSISSITDAGVANFQLNGRTTDGTSINIVGTLAYNGGTATMNASWIAPSYYGTVHGQASVANASTNSGGGGSSSDMTISGATGSLTINNTRSFSVSGGTSPYNWSSSGGGSFNPTTGASTTFTAPPTTGTVTITVTDGNSKTKTTTVTITN